MKIMSRLNVLVEGSGVLRYRVFVDPGTGLPEIELLTAEEWTSAVRMLQVRSDAGGSGVCVCMCVCVYVCMCVCVCVCVCMCVYIFFSVCFSACRAFLPH